MTNRRQLLLGGLVPALVPVALLEASEEAVELRWTTDLPTVSGYYLRRNPRVHSFNNTWIEMDHFNQLTRDGLYTAYMQDFWQWFGPIPVPWGDDE